MSEIKVSLSIELPGGTMLSQKLAESFEEQNLAGFTKHSMSVDNHTKVGKKIKTEREIIHFKTRNSIPAYQSLNISKEAYIYMTGKECPSFISQKDWVRLSKSKKLEMHLNEIASSLGGKIANYHVFED